MYAASMYRNAHRHEDHQQLLLRLCMLCLCIVTRDKSPKNTSRRKTTNLGPKVP